MRLLGILILPLIVSSPATFVVAAVCWRAIVWALSSPVLGDGTEKVCSDV